MKIYSELTNKEYATVDACVADEEKYLKKQEEEKRHKAELADTRKARAKEVEEAMKIAVEAQKEANAKLNAFIKDYGTYHVSLAKDNLGDFFTDIFDLFRL